MMRRAPPPAAAPIVALLTVLFTGVADWDWDGLCVEIVALSNAPGTVALAVTVLDVP